ncbi:hypothetical protein N0V88_007048 [Collariella sp. IMI 366227]|nr:hypothetical protein N0V88_007048 [Collariella sp. IMI 366227]
MRWQTTLTTTLLSVRGAHASISALIAEGLSHTSSPSISRRLQHLSQAQHDLHARQVPAGNTPLNADGSLNMAAWDAAVNSACRDALRGLHHATNPSGTCVCYNLPLLDNSTGTFEADLRLFQLNEPGGVFEGIPQEGIEVELSYRGASVSEVKRAEALVMPIVTLKAINGDNQPVSTNVSSNEAAFVTGVFSSDVVMSNFRMAELAVEAEIAKLKNGTVAFVLPGVQLMIFPVGLIITSVWLVAGMVAYGFGTYTRYNFREAHRRRMALVEKGGVARI